MTTEKPQRITCSYPNEKMLYLAYMPFIKGGGLFIRTKNNYEVGCMVNLEVKLMDDPNLYQILTKVIWITPKGAQGNKQPGIGVQFSGDGSRALCNKIETILAGMLKSSHETDTL